MVWLSSHRIVLAINTDNEIQKWFTFAGGHGPLQPMNPSSTLLWYPAMVPSFRTLARRPPLLPKTSPLLPAAESSSSSFRHHHNGISSGCNQRLSIRTANQTGSHNVI